VGEAAATMSRLPAGHPEGYLEGFANLYRAFAARIRGASVDESPFPTVEEGARGVRFIETVIASSEDERWLDF
jgi:predicted dehydrogenase